MILGLLKEYGTETRVALLPETVKAFTDLKVEVLVEQGAGENAFAADADYIAVGAKIVSRADVFSKSDVLLQIQPPADGDTQKIKDSQIWTSAFNPLKDRFSLLRRWQDDVEQVVVTLAIFWNHRKLQNKYVYL